MSDWSISSPPLYYCSTALLCIRVVCFAGNIQVNVPVSLNSTIEVVGKSVEQGEVTIQNKIEIKSDELVKVSGEL